MAPEILTGEAHYTGAVDVYSYGILCACVWNDGRQPYAEYSFKNPLEMQNAVVTGVRPTVEDCPDELTELMQRCWGGRGWRRR